MSENSDLFTSLDEIASAIEEKMNQSIFSGCVMLPLREYRRLISVEKYSDRQQDKLRDMVRVVNGQAIVNGTKIEDFFTDWCYDEIDNLKPTVIVWDGEK